MNTRTANEAILLKMQGTQDFHPARGFHPASANLFADWTLEPGDVLTVRSEGTDYAVPVYTMDLSWNGDSTVRVQSSGNKQRDPPSELARRNYGYGRGQKALEDEQDGIKARLVENENSIGLVVTNTQGGKVVNAASIVAGINATTGASTVHIDADHIQLTGDTGIIGKLEAYDVAFADVTCADVWCKDIYPDGDIVEAVDISASNFIDISGTDPVNLGNCYVDVTKSTSGNTITLTFKTAKGATKDVSFSRATALEGTWDRGILDVEASPQGVHYTDYLGQGTATWNGTTVSIPVTHCISASGTFSNTGYTFSLNTASKLQAKTGTAKITSNGTVTPDSGYIGLSSVEVDVQSGGDRSVTALAPTGTTTYASNVYTIQTDVTYDSGSNTTSSIQIPISVSNYQAASSGAGTYTITIAGNSDRSFRATGAYNAGKADGITKSDIAVGNSTSGQSTEYSSIDQKISIDGHSKYYLITISVAGVSKRVQLRNSAI